MFSFSLGKKEKMAEKAHQAAAAYRWDYLVDNLERLFLKVLDQKNVRY